jgi:hypothetical protein
VYVKLGAVRILSNNVQCEVHWVQSYDRELHRQRCKI